jgi:uncharacterized protein YlxW (UPF0749 family)
MKNYFVLLVLSISILALGCAKSDTSAEQQKTETVPAIVQTDSAQIDSVVTNIQKSAEDLKKQSDEVQKAVDDLLK